MKAWTVALSFLLILLVPSGCGKKQPDFYQDALPVDANVTVEAICPQGTRQAPVPLKLGLFQCDGVSDMSLTRPPRSLIISADCRQKLLTVRFSDRSSATLWQADPAGYFNVQMDTVTGIGLADDGAGNKNCTTYGVLALSGRLHCNPNPNDPNLDSVTIEFYPKWILNQTPPPGSVEPGSRTCSLPKSCYLGAEAKVRQCPL